MNYTQNAFGISPWLYFKVRFLYFFFHLPMDKLIWEYRLEQYIREESPMTHVSSGSHFALFGIPMSAKQKLECLQSIEEFDVLYRLEDIVYV